MFSNGCCRTGSLGSCSVLLTSVVPRLMHVASVYNDHFIACLNSKFLSHYKPQLGSPTLLFCNNCTLN